MMRTRSTPPYRAAPLGSPPPTTAQLLQTFFADDELEVGCEACGEQRATVRHRVSQLPRVLMLHLKRFEMGER